MTSTEYRAGDTRDDSFLLYLKRDVFYRTGKDISSNVISSEAVKSINDLSRFNRGTSDLMHSYYGYHPSFNRELGELFGAFGGHAHQTNHCWNYVLSRDMHYNMKNIYFWQQIRQSNVFSRNHRGKNIGWRRIFFVNRYICNTWNAYPVGRPQILRVIQSYYIVETARIGFCFRNKWPMERMRAWNTVIGTTALQETSPSEPF